MIDGGYETWAIPAKGRRSPAFWAAARLVTFANLEIKRENWQTLWWSTEEGPQE